MTIDEAVIAEKYAYAVKQAKSRAREFGTSVYVLAYLAVHNGLPYIAGFSLSDHHDCSAVCRVDVGPTGALTILEI